MVSKRGAQKMRLAVAKKPAGGTRLRRGKRCQLLATERSKESKRFWFDGVRYTCQSEALIPTMKQALTDARKDKPSVAHWNAKVLLIKLQYGSQAGGNRRAVSQMHAMRSPAQIVDSQSGARRRRTFKQPNQAHIGGAEREPNLPAEGSVKQSCVAGSLSHDELSDDAVKASAPGDELQVESSQPLVTQPVQQLRRCAGIKFEVVRRIGDGAFGRVFEAVVQPPWPAHFEKQRMGRFSTRLPRIAVKVANKSAGDAETIGKEMEEVFCLRKVKGHIRVPELLAFMVSRFTIQLFFNLAECDLDKCIRREGGLSEKDGKMLSVQMVSAVMHIHSKLVLHRDIKPANILLYSCQPLEAALADFGWATDMEKRQAPLERTVVTAPYRAPEIDMMPRQYSYPIDIWALGVTLSEAEMGRTPFCPAVGGKAAHRDETLGRLMEILKMLGKPPLPGASLGNQGHQAQSILQMMPDRPPMPFHKLPLGRRWGAVFRRFISKCLTIAAEERLTPSEDPWISEDISR